MKNKRNEETIARLTSQYDFTTQLYNVKTLDIYLLKAQSLCHFYLCLRIETLLQVIKKSIIIIIKDLRQNLQFILK